MLEIRRLKARIDSERMPRGADPATHTKLGRGGLGDVEWTAQLLQLRHAGRVEAMRTTGTVDALQAASAAGLHRRGGRAHAHPLVADGHPHPQRDHARRRQGR